MIGVKWIELQGSPPAREAFFEEYQMVHTWNEPVSKGRVTIWYNGRDLVKQFEILGGGERWFTVEN